MTWTSRPNANGKGTYYGPDWSYDVVQAFYHTKDWLYGQWDKEKLQTYELLNVVPGISNYMDYLLSVRADEEYLRRYGMDYSDIHDPRKLSQTGSASSMIRSTYMFTSSNIKRLYK